MSFYPSSALSIVTYQFFCLSTQIIFIVRVHLRFIRTSIEFQIGRFADLHLCVTKAMSKDLSKKLHFSPASIHRITVCYDLPNPCFYKLSQSAKFLVIVYLNFLSLLHVYAL